MPLIPFPDAGHLPRPRRGHRRRHPPRPRQGQARARPTCSAARRRRCARRSSIVAEVSGRKAPKRAVPTRADEGDDPDRPPGRQDDGTAAEPARADLLRRRRHLLGQLREGEARARLRAARPRGGPARRRSRPRASCPAAAACVSLRDARHRRRAPRAPARDRLLGGRRRPRRPRPRVLAADPAGGDRRASSRGRCCSPTSTSTTPPRPGRWCAAGPTSRSTSTSAAPRT